MPCKWLENPTNDCSLCSTKDARWEFMAWPASCQATQVAELGRGAAIWALAGIGDLGHLPGSSTCCGWKIPDCVVAGCVVAAEAGSPRKASALPMKKVPPSRLCTSASLAISLVDSSSTSAKMGKEKEEQDCDEWKKTYFRFAIG